MALGNYRLDQWLLGAISGTRELGLYSVAVAWAEILFYLPGVLVIVQRPFLVRASAAEAARRASAVFRLAIILSAPSAALVVLLAPLLCVTVFGHDFAGSVDDLRILALGAFGVVGLELLGNALTAQRRPMLTSGALAISFAVTVALDIALIPAHGGAGAALASVLAYTAGGAAVMFMFVRAFRTRIS